MKTHVRILAAGVLLTLLALAGAVWGASPQKITITMRDFGYTPSKITVQAGVPAEITLVNKGKVAHEFMVYGMPKMGSMMGDEMGHEWVEKTNYFRNVEVRVEGGKVKRVGGHFFELHVASGKSATIAFTPVKKGTFEFGCMIEGHYEAGQKGVLVVK